LTRPAARLILSSFCSRGRFVSPLASTRVRATLALLALLGQLTPAVALPVYVATRAPHSAPCGCVLATVLTHTTCEPEPGAEKRGCCGCCGPKADGACARPKPAPRPAESGGSSVKAHDTCACSKPNPASASEPEVPAETPVAVRIKIEAEPHVPQSAPAAPPSLPAPPAPPPRP